MAFTFSGKWSGIQADALAAIEPEIRRAHTLLRSGTGKGSDFTDWLTLPRDYDKAEFAAIQDAAAKIRSDSEVLIVIGIGGS